MNAASPKDDEYTACLKTVAWLEKRVIQAARGDLDNTLDVEPSGKFWLGRLQPEATSAGDSRDDRGERMEPCAVGIRIRPVGAPPWHFRVRASARAWVKRDGNIWHKTERISIETDLDVTRDGGRAGREDFVASIANAIGTAGLAAEIRADYECIGSVESIVIQLVNVSPQHHDALKDTRLYECAVSLINPSFTPFELEALRDSFRYDRKVSAYGINCGVERVGVDLVSSDTVQASRMRPAFWGCQHPEPDFSFSELDRDPIPTAEALCHAHRSWGEAAWSNDALLERGSRENWNDGMAQEARRAAEAFWNEHERIAHGVELLKEDPILLRAFRAMNRAIGKSAGARGYNRWRAFQLGFILSNLRAISEPDAEADIVDIVWFATGGGKTETYLGLLVTAALYDRLRAKVSGVTAWTRFPLRMLSLQQLQRFADALAAAEIVRREEEIAGDPISLGFFVGGSATPNKIPTEPERDGDIDIEQDGFEAQFQVLQHCPFCRSSISMHFNRIDWKLEHRCTSPMCPWEDPALPFYVVDDEIYRFLPTVIVGTLDKAASIGMQASMRGLVGPPVGMCGRAGHGYVYSPRSTRPNGCLVPGCTHGRAPTLPMEQTLFGPSFRLQDELHLLRDSLGAVDAHYEALLDGLEVDLCGRRPKILASSATLEGYAEQVDVLYRRNARVFPEQGPSVSEGFWTTDSNLTMRRFLGVAPRGLTIEFAVDTMLTAVQSAIRELAVHPDEACAEIGVDPAWAPTLLSLYGTNVVYGNVLRDLDAIDRSIQSGQIHIEGALNWRSLTGRTDFEEVRQTLDRLEKPEATFDDRIHLLIASSMMSHGVDVDRLNVMMMVGLPLGAAEFIQSSARVGRRYPGLVFVAHKIGRERDAGIFRSFSQFVLQGDRFVEPIPVTRRSRRVLDLTLPGLELARILAIHEAEAGRSLFTIQALASLVRKGELDFDEERTAIMNYLQVDPERDPGLTADIDAWFSKFSRNIRDPLPGAKFLSHASPRAPMRSLRDVEEQVELWLDRT